jgi:hypothetical protein
MKPRFLWSGRILEISSKGTEEEVKTDDSRSDFGEEDERVETAGQVEDLGYQKNDKRKIEAWSRASRGRLLKRALAVPWEVKGEAVMAELSYHVFEGITGRDVQRDLKALYRRMKREYPLFSGIWKMEFQRRGAPHVHLLLSFPGWCRWDRSSSLCRRGPKKGSDEWVQIRAFQDWLKLNWWEITGEKTEAHLKRGASAYYAENLVKAGFYFAGYSAKASKEHQNTIPEGFEGMGRFWGAWNMPQSWEVEELTWSQYWRARRVVYKLMQSRRELTWRDLVQKLIKEGQADLVKWREVMSRRPKRRSPRGKAGVWTICEDVGKVMSKVLNWAKLKEGGKEHDES